MLRQIFGPFASSLQAEKAPYVITLFVAALGWTALRTADRLQQTPFVEYQTELIALAASPSSKFATIRLRNVTSGQTFDCFILEQLTPGKFGQAIDQRIRYRGNVAANTTLTRTTSGNWQWEVRDFMPGADLELGAPLGGSELWNVLVRPCDGTPTPAEAKDGVKPKRSTPVLLERSLVTRYVENELIVLWAGLVVWLLLLVGLNWKRSTAPASAAPGAHGSPLDAALGPAPAPSPAPAAAPAATPEATH